MLIDGDPVAVFSGGSLLVGATGRTDLLGLDRARQLARLQHTSLGRLATLPDQVGLYPTHGEGSWGHLAGSVHHYVPDLLNAVPDALDRERPVVVGYATGYRSAVAAGLLERHGYEPVVLTDGGVPDVLAALEEAIPA